MAVTIQFDGDEKQLLRALQRQEQAIDKLKGRLRETGRAGKRTGEQVKKAFSPSTIAKFAGGLVGAGGVTAGLLLVNRGMETWLTNMREVGAATRKAANEMVAFAALQEGGTKAERVRAAVALGRASGISAQGEIWNTVQALQSARGGDFKAGMKAAKTVFKASEVGIPVEFGRELEVLGASQGQAPGQALRRAFAAGQASARDPGVLARAAAGLTFWKDKELGFAAAGVIAGSVKPEQLETFTKAGGIGLSQASGLADWYKKEGLEQAGPLERLAALRTAGLTTPETLAGAGLGEIRQQQAVATLVNNLEEVRRIQAQIREQAVPGLFTSQRRAVDVEIPAARRTATIERIEAAYKEETVFGGRAGPAQELEIQQRLKGLALRRLGKEEFGWMDRIDTEGRPNPMREFFASMLSSWGGDAMAVPDEMMRLRGPLNIPYTGAEAARVLGRASETGYAGLEPTFPGKTQYSQFNEPFTPEQTQSLSTAVDKLFGIAENLGAAATELREGAKEMRGGPLRGRAEEDR